MTDFRDPRRVLAEHGLRARKYFGQNFLVAAPIPPRIAAAGGAGPGDVAFEIGAGLGTLTHALAARGGKVIALEYDRDLVPVLEAELAGKDVEVRQGNVLDVDWNVEAETAGQPLIVYGNLPYHLSTPVIMGLLASSGWARACFLLQREFAERAAAAPGDKGCSALSAQVALRAHATVAFPVSAGCFHPRPKVESAVLVLERRAELAADVGDEADYRAVVRTLFGQRRKMARKAMRALIDDPVPALEEAGLDPRRRGETFTLDELAALSRAVGARRASTR